MQKLLIHCQGAVEHGEQIKSFIETRLPYEVSISFDRQMTQDLLTQRSINMLLFETNKFNEMDLQMLKDLRSGGFVYPNLVVAENIEIPNFHTWAEKFKTHVLTKPFEFKALRGITQKLMLARQVPQQMHRRFRTQQNTVLETFLTGEVISSQMFNLSVGGAYFEFTGKPRVAVGDLVRLKINLNDVSREHNVNARVVWTTRKGLNGSGPGAGVRFIKGHDIYRQLMDKV